MLAEALQGGRQLTRTELGSVLQRAGIACDNLLRLGYFLIHAELDGIICSGARRGTQFTYALLDERAPQSKTLDRLEALAEFALRYFTGHGPATLQDFVWWSGLTATDAKAGLDMVSSQFTREVIDGQTYWSSGSVMPPIDDVSQAMYLLPNFDEYTVGYTDRSAVIDEADMPKFDPRMSTLNNAIVLHGRIVGTWKRTLKKDSVSIAPTLFTPLNEAETRALTEAANRYGAFLGLSANLLE